MKIELASRIRELPPYPFARIDALKADARARGVDLVDLGIGDPDLPTPAHIVAAAAKAAADPRHHQYPSYVGMMAYRESAARFCQRRFGIKLDPAREVVALIGSKEGIAHFPVAFVEPGDVVLCPDPGYPVYATGTRFSGGEPYFMPLRRDSGFLPDLKAIPADVARRAKVMWVNYPNNPTAALAPKGFYEDVVEFALKHDIIVASDMAYSEIYYGGAEPPRSILEIPGARECAIEFHSLSKTFNMTGWRVGFAIGNEALVGGLGKVKTNVDSGVFEAVQVAAMAGLDGDLGVVAELRREYEGRVNILCDGLSAAGFDVIKPRASFYCLIANPKGVSSLDYSLKLLEAGVVATPATGFGAGGEGFVRLTVCAPRDRLALAVERLKTLR